MMVFVQNSCVLVCVVNRLGILMQENEMQYQSSPSC